MKITTPIDVTHAEAMTWVDALKRGAGSYAEVARVLHMTPVTLQRWRDDDTRTWPWWWRDTFNAAVGLVDLTLRSHMMKLRRGCYEYVALSAARKRMFSTLDRLPPRAYDTIMPTLALSPNTAAAIAFLQETLDKGPKRVGIIRRRAEAQGIAAITLARASQKLGVVKRQVGFGVEKVVTWEMPDDHE